MLVKGRSNIERRMSRYLCFNHENRDSKSSSRFVVLLLSAIGSTILSHAIFLPLLLFFGLRFGRVHLFCQPSVPLSTPLTLECFFSIVLKASYIVSFLPKITMPSSKISCISKPVVFVMVFKKFCFFPMMIGS
jgi:hypothetical protein